jgi:(4-(4-[2-(gamma-L-glutamylamino)ethyl]phenoxymethyl)furan-2-yl)methanamine synthase
MTVTAGYDIGGAHLKVARMVDGRLTAVRQIACPLWEGLDRLDAALDQARDLTQEAAHHAVTMTGELCELFPTRRDGVLTLSRHITQRLGPATRFYMGLKGFGDVAAVAADPEAVASANFLATAQAVARLMPHALLIDMGSTTTDIIACDRPQGLTDAERLQTGELVYTGFTRTPVPSVATRAVLTGQWQSLACSANCPMMLRFTRRPTGVEKRLPRVWRVWHAASDVTARCGIWRAGGSLQRTSASSSCARSTTGHCRSFRGLVST